MTEKEFREQINCAFKACPNLIELAGTTLAEAPFLQPALIPDDPDLAGPEGHARALMVALSWAVTSLAPGATCYPIGTPRPLDDPTWMEQAWWRYNVLRHLHLEPLHPDQFRDGENRVDTLIALTGIPSRSRFFRLRTAGIRKAARLLQESQGRKRFHQELRELAAGSICRSLEQRSEALHLLSIAATFRSEFPISLLIELAEEERVREPLDNLDLLTSSRILIQDVRRQTVRVPRCMQEYLHSRQEGRILPHRHRRGAELRHGEERYLAEIWHLLMAQDQIAAFRVIDENIDLLILGPEQPGLITLLRRFQKGALPPDAWITVQRILTAVLKLRGDLAGAMRAGGRALRASHGLETEADVLIDLGVIHTRQDPELARQYFQQARKLLPPGKIDRPDLLIGLACIHGLHEEFEQALSTYLQAQELIVQEGRIDIQAFLWIKLAEIRACMNDLEQAEEDAREALAIASAHGWDLHVADAEAALGRVAWRAGNSEKAQEHLARALPIARRYESGWRIASILLHSGSILYSLERFAEAAEFQEEALVYYSRDPVPQLEVRARISLCRTYLRMNQLELGRYHWRSAWMLANRLEEEACLNELEELRPRLDWVAAEDQLDRAGRLPLQILDVAFRQGGTSMPNLIEQTGASASHIRRSLNELSRGGRIERVGKGRATCYRIPTGVRGSPFDPRELLALEVAKDRGTVTTRWLVDAAGISRSTAQRILARLVEQGRLKSRGAGPRSDYVLA